MNAGAVPAQRLLELIAGGWTTQALYVAAELRLADALAAGPRTSDDVAAATMQRTSSSRRFWSSVRVVIGQAPHPGSQSSVLFYSAAPPTPRVGGRGGGGKRTNMRHPAREVTSAGRTLLAHARNRSAAARAAAASCGSAKAGG
jgi:hypothetical protein